MLLAQSFAITGATSTAVWGTLLIAAAMFGGAAFLFWLGAGSQSVSYSIDGGKLTIKAPFYGRTIELAALKAGDGRVVRAGADGEALAPADFQRQSGIGLPGCSIGWYLLNGTQEKALVCWSGASGVYVPTTEGYALVLASESPDELLTALKGE